MNTPSKRSMERGKEIVFDDGGIACPQETAYAKACEKESPCVCCESAIKRIALAFDRLVDEFEKEAEKAVNEEPENPGSMPEEMWIAICNDRDAAENAFRINTILCKQNIRARILAIRLKLKGGEE